MEGTCRKGARVVMREGGRDEVAVDEEYLPTCCKSCSCAHEGAAWESGQESRRFGGWCQAEGGVVITLVIV